MKAASHDCHVNRLIGDPYHITRRAMSL